MARILTALLTTLLFVGAAGCDNVGNAFDRPDDGDDPDAPAGTSTVEVVPVGGDTREGRPRVRAAFPSGGGWPLAVPIVVEFSESLNRASILPSTPTGTDARVILRVRGTTQILPCQYDFVANGRVLVMRPLAALSNAEVPTYEVVMLPDARDADGVRFRLDGAEEVLTDFQVNQDPSFTDGRILTTFPRDNARDVTRETDVFVFFDRPANLQSITPANLRVRQRNGADVTGVRSFPLTVIGEFDPRVVRFRPAAPLAGSTTYELVVDATITFGQDGELDFRGRTPFAQFDTVGPAAPASVVLGNPAPGFPNKVNRSNVGNAVLHVTTAADTLPGDRVAARIYGGVAETANTADLHFVERTAEASGPGTQTLTLDFSGLLGTADRPEFDDGDLVFAVQTRRGSVHSGYVHDTGDEARFDITLPTLSSAGPPSLGGFNVATDQEDFAFFGTASEAVGEVRLADGVNPEVSLFAADENGRFLLHPISLGRLSAPRQYSLTLRDRAGNFASGGAVGGTIVQRGIVKDIGGTDLVVEVYDHSTLLPIANATVVVDPEPPTVPSSNQTSGLTDSSGRITFPGAGGVEHTITVARSGFDLLTVCRTRATYLSLPLEAVDGGTATLQGTLDLEDLPIGATALVGCTAFDDWNEFAVRTSPAAPSTIPPTAIRANRPAIVTAFAGVFEPTTLPAFAFQGIQPLGDDLLTPTPPPAPPAAGQAMVVRLDMLASDGGFGGLVGAYTKDFGLSVGLNTSSLVGGGPIVRATSTVLGFGAQVLMGVGRATPTTGAMFDIEVNWSKPGFEQLAPFGANEATWCVAEAVDTAGQRTRHRARVLSTGFIDDWFEPLSIPAVTLPSAPSGPPLVEFADVLDPSISSALVATVDVVAVDATGRQWRMLVPDTDAAGGTNTVQFPDLSTTTAPSLVPGTWNVRAEARLWISLTGATRDDFVLGSRRRDELGYASGIAMPFTVQ